MKTYTVQYQDIHTGSDAFNRVNVVIDPETCDSIECALLDAIEAQTAISTKTLDIYDYWDIEEGRPELEEIGDIDWNKVIIESALRMAVWTFFTLVVQRWMHKHIVPKHPWLMFPFHRSYTRRLAENNADYMIPGAFWGIMRPRYGTFEEE